MSYSDKTVSLLRSLLAQRQASWHLFTLVIKIIFRLCAQVNGFKYFHPNSVFVFRNLIILKPETKSFNMKQIQIYRVRSQTTAQTGSVLVSFVWNSVIEKQTASDIWADDISVYAVINSHRKSVHSTVERSRSCPQTLISSSSVEFCFPCLSSLACWWTGWKTAPGLSFSEPAWIADLSRTFPKTLWTLTCKREHQNEMLDSHHFFYVIYVMVLYCSAVRGLIAVVFMARLWKPFQIFSLKYR